ncbi:MAG: hypothetical protein KC729_09360 [Candidatus Eisenbacteria bacterium]|uniref:Uncharacterized protein n=1 Tax=Eiseniibacteriota bacterium TaxID=2212470 RepID=A0A956LZH7_UNCEI|nr:hypothetical protein [Candidatus Eisenbacteria bacterium]
MWGLSERFARGLGVVGCGVFLVAASVTPSEAEGKADGFFRFGEVTVEVAHAYLFRVDTGQDEPKAFVFMTSVPVDATAAAAEFDVDDAVQTQVSDAGGGFIRLCLYAEGDECGLYFSNEEPSESFNTSGSGDFVLAKNEPDHVEGSFVLAEPEEFFDKTFQFELHFSADLAPAPASEALAEGGGAPGAAYIEYITAIADADFPKLREILGEAGSWQFPEDDPASCKEQLKWMRDGTPVTATISRGEQRGDLAILFVDGVDRDEIRRRGRVLMTRNGDAWSYETSDLESVED